MKPGTVAALSAGRELFNQGQHFEAHEVWEVAWRTEEGEPRVLLQALILVAAGCHKARLDEPRGAVKLLGSAALKLEALPELAAFRRAVLEALEHVQRWEAGGPRLVPGLQLDHRF